jgi:Putative mono-oxygenase ydhR
MPARVPCSAVCRASESWHGNTFETKENRVITAIVQFALPQPVTREKAREMFSSSAPRYVGVSGLVRKYFLLSQDGRTAGGVYLWQSQEDAELMYTGAWKRSIADKYGAEPSVVYYESPVIVDSVTGEIVTDA